MEKIGKYEVLGKIGVGGFGVVYKGRDPFIKRFVAIKTCGTEDEHIRQRFFREAEIAGNLHHRNVTTVYDFGFHGEIPYLVQEFLSGEDLDAVIQRQSYLPHDQKIDYLLQIAAGLEYAHAQGVIHRDIKPSNIRVLDGGRIKIMDFGIAKLANEQSALTRTGTTLGTAAYLAPEQIHGGAIDGRVDVFSFGVVGYELLTFRRPFQAKTISSLFYQILSQDPEPVERLWPQCPTPLAAVIERCLRKEPAERFADFTEVIAALEPILDGSRAEAQERDEEHTAVMPAAGLATDEGTAAVESAGGEELAALERRVTELLEQGDPTAAEIELTLARKRYGGGEVEARLEPLQQRLAELRQAREEERRQSEKVAGLLSRGRELERGRSFEEAALVVHAALEAAPGHAEAQALLERVSAKAAAERRARELQEASDGVAVLLEGGDLEGAAAALERLELEHGAEEGAVVTLRRRFERLRRRAAAAPYLRRAAELEGEGRLEEAIAELRQAQQADPDDGAGAASAERLEAEIARRRQERERAERLAAAAARVEESLTGGELARAGELLRQAEAEHGRAEPLALLGQRLEEALREERRARAATSLAEGEELRAEGELEAALERLQQAAAFDAGLVAAHLGVRELQAELAERRRAEQREAAIAAAMTEARALLDRGKDARAAALLARRRQEIGAAAALDGLAAQVEERIAQRAQRREQERQERQRRQEAARQERQRRRRAAGERRRQRLAATVRSVPARAAAAAAAAVLVVVALVAVWPEGGSGGAERAVAEEPSNGSAPLAVSLGPPLDPRPEPVETSLVEVDAAPGPVEPDSPAETEALATAAEPPGGAERERRERAAELVTAGRRALQQGSGERALRAVVDAQQLAPGESAVEQLWQDLLGGAERQAAGAQRRAEQAAAPELASGTFARATAQRQSGERQRGRDGQAAVRALWASAELFDQATREAVAEREARLAAQRVAETPRQAPATEPRPAQRAAASPEPPADRPRSPATAPPTTSAPTAATPDPAEAIGAALARYRRAAESLDAAAVAAVWPGVDRERLQRNYAGLDSLSMSLDGCRVRVAGDGATATCTMSQRVKPKVGREQTTSQQVEVRLQRRGDGWVIDSLAAAG